MFAKAASGKRAETPSLPFTGHKPWQVACAQWQELTAGTYGHSIQLFKEESDGRQEDPGTGKPALSHASYEGDGAKERQITFLSVAIQKLTPQ